MAEKAVKKKKAGKKEAGRPAKPKETRPTAGGPVLEVKEKFGSKENLIKEVKKYFEKSDLFASKLNEAKGVERISNMKLLRLHRLATEVSDRFGSRKALIDEYIKLAGAASSENLKGRLSKLTLGRLLDIYRRVERQSKKAAAGVERKLH